MYDNMAKAKVLIELGERTTMIPAIVVLLATGASLGSNDVVKSNLEKVDDLGGRLV